MAGADYGALVVLNGETLPPLDSHPAYDRRGYAELGEGPLRIVVHKQFATLYAHGRELDLAPFVDSKLVTKMGDSARCDEAYSGEIITAGDHYYFAILRFDGNMVDARLEEPDGSVWTARGGYGFRAGYENWDMYAHEPWKDYAVSLPA